MHTVEDARQLRGSIAGAHTKNLFVKDKKGALFLIVADEDAAIDLRTLQHRIGARGRLSFASSEVMARVLGVAPGSVTPLALVNDTEGEVSCVVDEALASADHINVHPLRNNATMTLAREDLFKVLAHFGHQPRVVRVTADGAVP